MSKLRLPLMLMTIIWITFLINMLVPIKLGVHPRSLDLFSLGGLVLNPFFHANLNHIVSNSLPLACLSFLYTLKFNSEKQAWIMTLLLIFVGSMGVWLFGSNANHIGASGLIFAYFGYLIGGIFTKSTIIQKLRDVVLGGFVMMIYGYLIWGLFTVEETISWSAHAWGFVAGVILSRFHYKLDKHSTE